MTNELAPAAPPRGPASTPSDVLLALADRCEREEPTYALDIAIELAITPGAVERTWDNHVKVQTDKRAWNPPNYTTSLDAAVTLEPKDAQIMVTRMGDGVWRVTYLGRPDINLIGGQKAPTEAQARVAMALRARAAIAKVRA